MADSPLITPEHKKSLLSSSTFGTRRSMIFAYGFTFAFFVCTIFIFFNNPSSSHSSIASFQNIIRSRSHFSSFFSHFFPKNSLPRSHTTNNHNNLSFQFSRENVFGLSGKINISSTPTNDSNPNQTDQTSSLKKVNNENDANESSMSSKKKMRENWLDMTASDDCDLFDGRWVRDDSYPLYEPGSCPHIDEPFDCFLNGRRDHGYEKFRWQPNGCNIPRLDGKHMLELLRGKRLVYVGDSLNRNMWESMVCILRNSVQDKSKVFEASGRQEFRTEGSYSFVFSDYNFSVEFFRSPFLVQEWEMPDTNGSKKETLRLDLIERSSDKYKSADVLVFNTGHWWTHEKTSKGEGYYQEGSHIYSELNVIEAFRKAMTTWARWVNANVDPVKTLVFFRGYSVSHFSGGEWNSGGQCDHEKEPIKNMKHHSYYPPHVRMLEKVLKGTKTPVFYLNVTVMTDYRKDAHPSVYRERRPSVGIQDCSHWCLPGVPDTWNELIYAQVLRKYHRRQHPEQLQKQQQRRH